MTDAKPGLISAIEAFVYLDETKIDWLSSQIEGSLVVQRSQENSASRSGKVAATAEMGGGLLASLGIGRFGGSAEAAKEDSRGTSEARSLTPANRVRALREYLRAEGSLPLIHVDALDEQALIDQVGGLIFAELQGHLALAPGPRGAMLLHSVNVNRVGDPILKLQLSRNGELHGPTPEPGEYWRFAVLAELVTQRGAVIGAPVAIWMPRMTAGDAGPGPVGTVSFPQREEALNLNAHSGLVGTADAQHPSATPDSTGQEATKETRHDDAPLREGAASAASSFDASERPPSSGWDTDLAAPESPGVGLQPHMPPLSLERQPLEWLTPEEQDARDAEEEARKQVEHTPSPADHVDKFDVRYETQRIRIDDAQVTRATLMLRLYTEGERILHYQLASDVPASAEAHWPTGEAVELQLDPVDRNQLGIAVLEVLATDAAVELRLNLNSPFGPIPCATHLKMAADGNPRFGDVLIHGRSPSHVARSFRWHTSAG